MDMCFQTSWLWVFVGSAHWLDFNASLICKLDYFKVDFGVSEKNKIKLNLTKIREKFKEKNGTTKIEASSSTKKK